MSEHQGEKCPYCGNTENCSHFVTSIDLSGADSTSMEHGRMEPLDPLGQDGTGDVSQALGALYLAFMKRDPRPTGAALAEALDVRPALQRIVREEFDGAFAEEFDGRDRVYVGEYDGYSAWVDYVRTAIEDACPDARKETDLKGPPLLTSSYGTWWAQDGYGVADTVNDRLFSDAARIRSEIERLREAPLP